MINHAARDHALLSASSAHRWLACPASALLEDQFPDTAGEAAEEGTLAHELAELRLTKYFKKGIGPKTWDKKIDEFRMRPLWNVDMLTHTEGYLDFVKSRITGRKEDPYLSLEERLDFSPWVPEGFGTADCLIIQGDTLEIIDFKYGKNPSNIVYAEHNPQMQLYALGAFQKYGFLFPIKKFALSIFQPRCDHEDTWEIPLEDLLAFGERVIPIAQQAFSGSGDFNPGVEQCKWCRARSKCRARSEENVQLAFAVEKKPPLLTNEEVGQYLLQGQDIQSWLKDLQDYALSEALAGRDVAGWKAVEGISRRIISDADGLIRVLTSLGFEEAMLYKPKEIETLGNLEKLVGKQQFTEVGNPYLTKPPGKPTLVKESDKRAAITNQISAEEAFQGGKHATRI